MLYVRCNEVHASLLERGRLNFNHSGLDLSFFTLDRRGILPYLPESVLVHKDHPIIMFLECNQALLGGLSLTTDLLIQDHYYHVSKLVVQVITSTIRPYLVYGDYVKIVRLQLWWRRHLLRRKKLAFMMAFHARLGEKSEIGLRLTPDLGALICAE